VRRGWADLRRLGLARYRAVAEPGQG